MIVIICNSFKEYQTYIRENIPKEEWDNFTYCTCYHHINQIQTVNVKEFRIISQVFWFSVQDWCEMMRRIK